MRLLAMCAFLWAGLASAAVALDESRVFDEVVRYLTRDADCADDPDGVGWERRVIPIARDGYRLRYSRFGCTAGPRGALAISPGRSEPSHEYAETAMDFLARGFGPVYVIDHRGQGLSPRLLSDPEKGHVERFSDYVYGFADFVDAVQADLAALGAGPEQALFLTSNSMGGAIGIGYFQKVGADNPFDAAAFVSAMIHVNYISFTDASPNWLNLRLYSESGVALQTWWRCRLATLWDPARCEDYASERTFGGYKRHSRQFEATSEAMMTQSRARYALRTFMWDDFDWTAIRDAEYAGEHWRGPQLGGNTNNWAGESVRFLRQMRSADSLGRMVHVPILLLSGTRDLRAYRQYARVFGSPPDLSRHTRFCDRVNDASLAAQGRYVCQFVAINGAFHEIYKERDAEREAAIETVDWFFRNTVQRVVSEGS